MFINDNDVGTDWKRRRAEGTRWRSHCQERVGVCGGGGCWEVHEWGRQWTTGRGSLKGMASVGWQYGRRESGKCATAERDKRSRTNRWWLTGSFIHGCDQIEQDSPPYGMAQLIHPVARAPYMAAGGEGNVCACACARACVCWSLKSDNKRRSEDNEATGCSVTRWKTKTLWLKIRRPGHLSTI